LGVLQWVAVRRQLQGLCFLSSRPWGYGLSLGLIVAPFAIFFLSRDRIQPGLEGLQQLVLFSLAAFLAVAFTLVVSSLLKRRSLPTAQKADTGLEALRDRTYFQAISRAIRSKGAGQG
ncbi:MAG: hypothetical protein AAB037_05360, partial [Chloroflexota bacterium]